MNIFNVDKLDEVLEQVAAPFNSRRIHAWLLGNFRNHALRHGPVSQVLRLNKGAPEWALTAFKADALYELDIPLLLTGLGETLDYLRHLDAREKDFSRMSVPDAHLHQMEHHQRLAALNDSQLGEDGIEAYLELDGGYRWVRVFGENSLKREGQMMGHCVGDYYRSVAADRIRIYSLRDPKNRPHVTVEVNYRNDVSQIKGRANGLVNAKYQPAVQAFLASARFALVCLDQSGLDAEAVRQAIQAAGSGTLGGNEALTLDVENQCLAGRGTNMLQVTVLRNDSTPVMESVISEQFRSYGFTARDPLACVVSVPGLEDRMRLDYRIPGTPDRRGAFRMVFRWPCDADRKRKRLPGWKVYDRYTGFEVLLAAVVALKKQGLLRGSVARALRDCSLDTSNQEVRTSLLAYLRSTLRSVDLDGWTLYTGHAETMGLILNVRNQACNAVLVRTGTDVAQASIRFTLAQTMSFDSVPKLLKGAAAALAKVRGQRRVVVVKPPAVTALAKFYTQLGALGPDRKAPADVLRLLSVRAKTVKTVVDALNAGDTGILARAFPDKPLPVLTSSCVKEAWQVWRVVYDNSYRMPMAVALCALLSERPPLNDPRVRQGLGAIVKGKVLAPYPGKLYSLRKAIIQLRASLPYLLPLTDAEFDLFGADASKFRKLYAQVKP